jgi:hypothetical protein
VPFVPAIVAAVVIRTITMRFPFSVPSNLGRGKGRPPVASVGVEHGGHVVGSVRVASRVVHSGGNREFLLIFKGRSGDGVQCRES